MEMDHFPCSVDYVSLWASLVLCSSVTVFGWPRPSLRCARVGRSAREKNLCADGDSKFCHPG